MRDDLYRVVRTIYVHDEPSRYVCVGFVVENGEVVDFVPVLRDRNQPGKMYDSWKQIVERVPRRDEMPLSTDGYDVAFSGPRVSSSEAQVRTLDRLLLRLVGYGFRRFHVGDCVGSDVQAWNRATQYFQVVIHPPIESTYRAFLTGIVVHEPRPYVDRNHAMVDASHVLVATLVDPREKSSGTFETVAYARQVGKPVYTIWPDGTAELWR